MAETDSILRMSEELRLSGVVTKSLPITLGTPAEPERYTVPALFTRRPSAREIAMMEDDGVRQRLADAGYDGVRLTVDDHRLAIVGTNLEELRRGLATLVATILHDASVASAEQEALRIADLKTLRDHEERRADLVAARAAQVVFQAAPGHRPQPPLLHAL